jgi:hypothetical protein
MIKLPISKIKPNPNNPRVIKDDKFQKLVTSIIEFPQMLELRPIVVNDDGVVLGGNMRLRACQEAGLKEVPVIKASQLSEEQQKEFIIKDNIGFGEWDWDALANEWDGEKLAEWGLDNIPNFNGVDLSNFFEDEQEVKADEGFVIKLEFTEDDYREVVEAFKQHPESREQVVYKLLTGKV